MHFLNYLFKNAARASSAFIPHYMGCDEEFSGVAERCRVLSYRTLKGGVCSVLLKGLNVSPPDSVKKIIR